MSKFEWPDGFLWGSATAAHQVEGGNVNNWSVWELQTAAENARLAPERLQNLRSWPDIKNIATQPENYVSGKTVDHFRRYKEDFDLVEKLGMNAFRFSVEWSRIQPQEGSWDVDAVEYYREYLRELRIRGIEPVMTLFHWSVPTWFADKGGFEKRSNIRYFTEYAEHLLRVLSDEVKYIVTINEPDTVALLGYWTCDHPPGKKSLRKLAAVYFNLLSAHKKVYKIAKKMNKNFNVGFVKTYAYVAPADNRISSKLMTRLDYLLRDDIPLAYLGGQTDFLGVNYYFTDTYDGWKRKAPDAPTTDLGWPVLPENLEPILKRVAKAGKPLMVTETGVADKKDIYRKAWLQKTVISVRNALEAGVDIRGYLYWSLTDNFEWAFGRWPAFGLIDIDYEHDLKRTIRPSAVYYAKIIASARAASKGKITQKKRTE